MRRFRWRFARAGRSWCSCRSGSFAFDLKGHGESHHAENGRDLPGEPEQSDGKRVYGQEFEEFLASVPDGVLVVLDEAYIDYAVSMDLQQSVEAYRKRKNLLILRTFSKVYGLAGLRIGYAIGRPELLSAMNKLRTPFNYVGSGAGCGAGSAG